MFAFYLRCIIQSVRVSTSLFSVFLRFPSRQNILRCVTVVEACQFLDATVPVIYSAVYRQKCLVRLLYRPQREQMRLNRVLMARTWPPIAHIEQHPFHYRFSTLGQIRELVNANFIIVSSWQIGGVLEIHAKSSFTYANCSRV